MVQAAVLDGQVLDLPPSLNDGRVTPEVGVSGRDIAEALVIAVVVVMIDEGADLRFQVARQIVVLQQNTVFHGLVPTLDLALGLRVIRGAPDVVDALVFKPIGQIARDVGRAVVAEQPRHVDYMGLVAT